MKIFTHLIFLACIIYCQHIKATSITICDTIRENTIWDADTVNITCRVVVDSGATLTVTPGTIVLFKNTAKSNGLSVYGSLIAEGTPDRRIRFTVEDTVRAYSYYGFGWDGIYFSGNQNGYSKLKYCVLSFTGDRFPKVRFGNGAIQASDYNDLIIENCVISKNFCIHENYINTLILGAITISNSKVKILSSSIINTTGSGIAIKGNKKCRIENCRITNNFGNGILTASDLTISGNIIAENLRAIGVISDEEVYVRSINNSIVSNQEEGIYCDANSVTLDVINTILSDNINTSLKKQILAIACKSVNISHSLIECGKTDVVLEDTNTIFIWEDNLEGDPNFVNPDTGDYKIPLNSIAVNSGTCDTVGLRLPKFDIAGNPRIFDGPYHYRIDIGAYECQADQEGIIPSIKHVEDKHMKLSDTLVLEVDFIYSDGDMNHIISVVSDNENIKIENLSGDTTGSTYEIITGEIWQGTGDILISVTDIYGNTGTNSFRVFVSEATCGCITENEVWDEDTVKVFCDVNIEEGATLEIKPGTVVEFYDYLEFNVRGRLLAVGTKDNPVKFTVHDTSGFFDHYNHTGWNGIRFSNISDEIDHSKTINCIVEYVINLSHLPEEQGGGVTVINSNRVIIDSCLFLNNFARYGGGIYLDSSKITISNCRIFNNKAIMFGGGIYVSSSKSARIINCHITNNYAQARGGGIYIGQCYKDLTVKNCIIADNDAYRGGGISLSNCKDVFLINNTIYYNRANRQGPGIACSREGSGHFLNSIIYQNRSYKPENAYIYLASDAEVSFEYCDIEGGLSGIDGTPSGYINNIDVDPGFFNAGLGDFSLDSNSYCINRGTPDTTGLNLPLIDFAGNPRVFGDTIDIGAYEYFLKYHVPTDLLLSNTDVFENTPSGTIVGKFTTQSEDPTDVFTLSLVSSDGILDADNNSFAILGDSLFINEIPDYETKNEYSIYVRTTYNGHGNSSMEKAFNITVRDINEAPVIEDQTFSVNENSIAGTFIGNTAALDEDKGQTLYYTILYGNIDHAFYLDSLNGDLKVNNTSALDFETNPQFIILYKATDNGTEPLADSASITIIIKNLNEPPVIMNRSFSVNENSLGGTLIGNVSGFDEDIGQTLSYTISEGNTNNAFWLDPLTGDLRANNSTALDFETNSQFIILYKATDNGTEPLADSASITINLIDMEEISGIQTPVSDILKIYPNPASDDLVIEFANEITEELILELKSVSGSVLMNTKTTNHTSDNKIILDITGISKGLYFITLKNDHFILTRKIEIVR